MKKIKLRKIFKGLASVRSYIVEDCIKNNESLKLSYNGESMVLSPEDLKTKAFQLLKNTSFDSKFGTESYQLIDYGWRPNELS